MYEELISLTGTAFIITLFIISLISIINQDLKQTELRVEYETLLQKLNELIKKETVREICETNGQTIKYKIENIETGEYCQSEGFNYQTIIGNKRIVLSMPKIIEQEIYKIEVY